MEGKELYSEKREHWAKLSNPMFKRGITDLKVIYYLQDFFLRQEKGEKVNSYVVIMYKKTETSWQLMTNFAQLK